MFSHCVFFFRPGEHLKLFDTLLGIPPPKKKMKVHPARNINVGLCKETNETSFCMILFFMWGSVICRWHDAGGLMAEALVLRNSPRWTGKDRNTKIYSVLSGDNWDVRKKAWVQAQFRYNIRELPSCSVGDDIEMLVRHEKVWIFFVEQAFKHKMSYPTCRC